MYILEQIAIKIPKNINNKVLAEEIAYNAEITRYPNDFELETVEYLKDELDEIRTMPDDIKRNIKLDSKSLELEYLFDNLFYATEIEAPKNTPKKLLTSFIKETDQSYLIYLPKTRKGGYWIEEKQEYSQGFFDNVKEQASKMNKLLNKISNKVKVSYDAKSELEEYEKRRFQTVE